MFSFKKSWKYDFSSPFDPGEKDLGIIVGFSLCALLLVGSLLMGSSIGALANPFGFLIVAGGTLGATFVHFSVEDVKNAYQSAKSLIYVKQYNPKAKIQYIVQLAQAVRREGVLYLESESKRVSDPFLRIALSLAVDAPVEDDIRRILAVENQISSEQEDRAIQVFETMGAYAPAMGLIGTLLGLIQMLGSLDNPSTVGPAMAVALVTTLYGAICANMLFLPLAGKLRHRRGVEAREKALLVEGIISLGKQENPVLVEQKLQTFVPLAQVA